MEQMSKDILYQDTNWDRVNQAYGSYIYQILANKAMKVGVSAIQLNEENASHLTHYQNDLNFDNPFSFQGSPIYINNELSDNQMILVTANGNVDITFLDIRSDETKMAMDELFTHNLLTTNLPDITGEHIMNGYQVKDENIFEYSGIINESSFYIYLMATRPKLKFNDREVDLAEAYEQMFLGNNGPFGTVDCSYFMSFIDNWFYYSGDGNWEELDDVDDAWDNEEAQLELMNIIAEFLNMSSFLKAKYWLSCVRFYSSVPKIKVEYHDGSINFD